MTLRPLVLAALAALAVTACNKPEPAPAPAADTPVEAAADATSTTPAPMAPADAPMPEAGIDMAALAGTFEGTGNLMLNADGTYTLNIGEAADTGTWAAEPGDTKRVRLDPNSKTVTDSVLDVVSNDELRPVAGESAAELSGTPFKRVAATP